MTLREFRGAGHVPTLLCAFLYFDISFMMWVLLGALANSIVPQFQLTAADKGLMVAVPLLGGSLLRLVLGPMSDRIGARNTAIIGMFLTAVPLLLGWLWVERFSQLLLVGMLLGVAGASFAVALPLASRWYPAKYQGLALGIAGAGNSGTCLATFFGPQMAQQYGWQTVMGMALIPLAVTMLIFVIFARESPNRPPPESLTKYLTVIRQADTGWFCLFYGVTFGGFVGLASFLNIFFHDQYGLDSVTAGYFATACVLAGSFLRPLGGYLADRIGGIRMLIGLYALVGLCLLSQALLPPLALATVLLMTIMSLFGLGNGAVFQLVPQRFPREIGVITGIVGAAGGVGGFFLPNIFGQVKQATESFGGGFVIVALIAFIAGVAMIHVSHRWEGAFVGAGGKAASPAPVPEPTFMAPAAPETAGVMGETLVNAEAVSAASS